MKTTGTHDPSATIEAWADVVIKMWQNKIIELNVIDKGYLLQSFINHVVRQAGGNTEKIDFMFRKYGIFADMGVGKETKRGNSGDLSGITVTNWKGKQALKRVPKPWYSRVFFREVSKLREYLAFMYGRQGVLAITEAFGDQIFDQRSKRQEKMVSSLRTISNRERNNARWRKNYAEFGFRTWKSRNKY